MISVSLSDYFSIASNSFLIKNYCSRVPSCASWLSSDLSSDPSSELGEKQIDIGSVEKVNRVAKSGIRKQTGLRRFVGWLLFSGTSKAGCVDS